jgi:hypothetical protein
MAYLRAHGGLQEAAGGYLAQFRAALGPGATAASGPATGRVLVAAQVEDAGEQNSARRVVLPESGAGPGGSVAGDMGQATTLANFIRWATQAAPAQHYALLILAHGVPPAPDQPDPDGGAGRLESRVLAQALGADAMPAFEVVFLDCCYAGSVEVADRVAGHARYLVAAPGLLYSPGLPWSAILGQLQHRPEMGGRDLALAASHEAHNFWGARPDTPASLVAVDLDRLPALTEALRQLAQTALPQVEQLTPALTLARGRASGWGPQRELVEVASCAEALAETTTSKDVAEQAHRVSVAAHDAIVEAWRQDPGQNGETGAGMGIFFPLNMRSWSVRYGSDPGESFEADWALLMRAYLQSVARREAGSQ